MRLPATVRAIAVTAKTGSTCTADIAGVGTVVEVARDITVAAGDALLLTRNGSTWFVVGRAGTAVPAAVENVDTVPPPKQVAAGTLVVPAVETRSYRDGAWRTDTDAVAQGKLSTAVGNSTGVAFYGTMPRSLDGTTVLAATVMIRRTGKGGVNALADTTLWLVTESLRPSGAVTLGSSTPGPSLRRGDTVEAFTVPTAWAQSIVDGTAGGLAVFDSDGSPYVVLAGRGDWGPAFTLNITWKR